VVSKIRSPVCQEPRRSPGPSRRHLASRRNVRVDPGRTTLSVVCGRSGWRSAGYSGAKATGHLCRAALLSQIAEGAAVCAVHGCNRSLGQLWSSMSKPPPPRCASPRATVKQPRRGLASTDSPTRASHALLQISWPSTAFSRGPRSD